MFSFFLNWLAKYFSRDLFRHKKTSTQPFKQEKAASLVEQPSTADSRKSECFQADILQKEIRAERKFSLAEAIGREGGGFMKGESVIPRPLKAANEIKLFIATHSPEPSGILATELSAWSIADIRLSRQLETPLAALSQIVDSLLHEPTTFYEFARQVAIAQSKVTGDRPYFQQPDQPPHPEADYSHSSISQYLSKMAELL